MGDRAERGDTENELAENSDIPFSLTVNPPCPDVHFYAFRGQSERLTLAQTFQLLSPSFATTLPTHPSAHPTTDGREPTLPPPPRGRPTDRPDPCGFLTHLARYDVQRMTEAPAFPPPDLA